MKIAILLFLLLQLVYLGIYAYDRCEGNVQEAMISLQWATLVTIALSTCYILSALGSNPV